MSEAIGLASSLANLSASAASAEDSVTAKVKFGLIRKGGKLIEAPSSGAKASLIALASGGSLAQMAGTTGRIATVRTVIPTSSFISRSTLTRASPCQGEVIASPWAKAEDEGV